MVDVFISYSRTDLAAVTRLAEGVEAEGYEVWWDADLPPHLSYGDVITAKIGMAKAAIVVWSRDSAASEWVRAEADMARNQKKLVQTALDNVMPPLPFNQIQFAEIGDWRGEPDHPGWRKVKASLAELCGRETGTMPRPARQPVPAPPAASKWPLFAGIGLGALALAAAGWIVLREPAPPSPPEPDAPPAPAAPSAPEEAAAPAEQPAAPIAVAPELPPEPAPAAAPPAPEPAPSSPAIASTEGMVFADSDRRRLTVAELTNLGPATLEIARTEIYARKGRRFRRADLRAHFSQLPWYRPRANEAPLTALEQQNVAMIRRAESRFGQ